MRRPKRFRQRVPYPIAELPSELKSPKHKLLLFCGPDQGGWRLGFWYEDSWRDVTSLKDQLDPSHFALASFRPQTLTFWNICGIGVFAQASSDRVG